MLFKNVNEANAEYDVVICGGGLAGQTLARQLKLHFPEVTVALIDNGRMVADRDPDVQFSVPGSK